MEITTDGAARYADLLCHVATVEIAAAPETVFAFMADGLALGRWALGSWGTQEVAPGLFAGRSLFEGTPSYIRIVADRKLMSVDYHVGPSPKKLRHVNSSRVIPGASLKRGAHACLMSLIAWRAKDLGEQRWHRICITHEAEVLLIQSWLNAGQTGPA
jgi:uncharacterized protein YndB with AHSA1/START domain